MKRREVKNAIEIYKDLSRFDPLVSEHLLQAHNILMSGLVKSSGSWRSGGVGIFKGKEIAHLPPPAKRVPHLMEDLFCFLREDKDISWLLKACIFHYELEFIHPFDDGNGRIGRLWQQLILMKEDPIFEYLPVEELIKKHQDEYYNVLGECDNAGESTKFIEFSLTQIREALREYNAFATTSTTDASSRLEYASKRMNKVWFSRKEYLQLHKNISSATASRDLIFGIEQKILEKRGDKNQARYKFLSF